MNAFLDALLQVAALAVTVLGGYAIMRLSSWLGVKQDGEVLKQDDTVRGYLLPIVDIAADAAERRLALALQHAPDADVAAERDREIAAAAAYVSGKAKEALARFGIDSNGLKDMLDARISPAAPKAP